MINTILTIFTSVHLLFWFNVDKASRPGNPFDYNLTYGARKSKTFELKLEHQRLNGAVYTNSNFMMMHEWEYLQIKGKDIRIESQDIRVNELSLLGRYNYYYAGVVALWQQKKPSQSFKFGVEYVGDINLLLSQPEWCLSIYTLTRDFRSYKKEVNSYLSFNLFTFGKYVDIDFKMNAQFLQYNNIDWNIGGMLELDFKEDTK